MSVLASRRSGGTKPSTTTRNQAMPITFRSTSEGEGRVMSMLSVVVPVFNEEDGIPELHRRLAAVLASVEMNSEIVLVNDGSQDRSPELLDELATADPAVVVVHLSRNFGHQAALAAGLTQARGQAVVV